MSDEELYEMHPEVHPKLISSINSLYVHGSQSETEKSVRKLYRKIMRLIKSENIEREIYEIIQMGKEHDFPQRFNDTLIQEHVNRKAAPVRKAQQRLALAKGIHDPSSTYSRNSRFVPGIAEMISNHLSQMPYNPEVAIRIKEEEENDRVAEYLEALDLDQYGGSKQIGGNIELIDAVENNDIDLVRQLLDQGADINFQSDGYNNGSTALSLASGDGHTDMVELLLDHRADPNIPDNHGGTALIWAAADDVVGPRKEIVEIVKLLLDNGANPNIQDQWGNTALMWAEGRGHTEIVELIKRNMMSTRIQSRFRGRKTRRKIRTQKAKQRLSMTSAMSKPSTYSRNSRYVPGISEMISGYLSQMPYNPEVTRRMGAEEREEEENERMAQYLDDIGQFGGRRRKSYAYI